MQSESDINNPTLDVVGIGNAIVDILVKVDDSFLDKQKLKKGGMSLINEEEAARLYSLVESGVESSGGSAANTLAGIAQLGGKAGFIGRVKQDTLGSTFTNDIYSAGAIFNTTAATEGPSTARCFIFVTPDAQRTMCTYLGASVLLNPESLNLSMVRETKVLYLEGYLWDQPLAKKAFLAGAMECEKSGGEVALSLSDSFCVERHRESFLNLIDNHVDILFANEEEIKSLFKTKSIESAINSIKGRCKVAVITCGKKGSVVLSIKERWNIQAFHLGKSIDTTGAGDLYASGFLYSYTKKKELKECGLIGSICAGKVVTQMGPRVKASLKDIIKKTLEKDLYQET